MEMLHVSEQIERLLQISEELKAKGEKELSKHFKDCANKWLDIICWNQQKSGCSMKSCQKYEKERELGEDNV